MLKKFLKILKLFLLIMRSIAMVLYGKLKTSQPR
jgi:hypothetical protein